MSEPLGPAVTETFPAAVGLHELLSPEKRAAAPPAPAQAPGAPAAPEVPAVEFSPKLFLNALRLADKIASRALRVEPEEPETVEELAGAIAPLVQYYAKGNSTVAALWGNLVLALIGVGYAKAEKMQARKRAAGEPEGAPDTPAQEEETDDGKRRRA